MGLCGIAVGTASALVSFGGNKQEDPKLVVGSEAKAEEYLLNEQPPDFPVARTLTRQNDTSGLKVTLFQYQTCPFCCKTRAFLDFFGINYNVIEVNSVTRKQVSLRSQTSIAHATERITDFGLYSFIAALVEVVQVPQSTHSRGGDSPGQDLPAKRQLSHHLSYGQLPLLTHQR